MRDKLSYSEAGKLGAIESAKGSEERKQKRIDNWNLNPKLCKFCTTPIVYEKRLNDFCNHNCAANFHNLSRGFTLGDNKIFTCLFCCKEFTAKGNAEHKYCSRDCMTDSWWQENKKQLLNDGYDSSSKHQIAKRYLLKLHEGKCQICTLDSWNGKPMPLVLDHINGHSEDGMLSNLRVICNNCDALTDTYKSKNKGNGRAKRRQRYKDGKSY